MIKVTFKKPQLLSVFCDEFEALFLFTLNIKYLQIDGLGYIPFVLLDDGSFQMMFPNQIVSIEYVKPTDL